MPAYALAERFPPGADPCDPPQARIPRLPALDALRFLAALVVAIAHLGVPFVSPARGSVGTPLQQAIGLLFSGGGAVMVFFLLSGFCIHLPYRDPAVKLSRRSFYIRRILRLCLPLAVWLPLAACFHHGELSRTLLWSLWAELIYYVLYPVLRTALPHVAWKNIYAIALGLALLLIALTPRIRAFHHYSPAVGWILGLPVWLLGVRLAECWQALRSCRALLWTMRFGLVVASVAVSLPGGIADGIRFNLFAGVAFYWLVQELHEAQRRPLPGWLVAAGGWSYSLYLVHIGVGLTVIERLRLLPPFASALGLGAALVFAFLFGHVIEKPSHALARRLGTVE
jgi:peptidoglycan/LPS O-acetylase OafA/YrhL